MSTPQSQNVRRVLMVSGVLVVAGAALLSDVPATDAAIAPSSMSPALIWTLLVTGFALAELMVFHIELRREAITLSLSEVPLAFGLLFLSPWALLTARLVGTVVGKVSTVRTAPYKFAFNLALVFSETALAIELLRRMNGVDLWESSVGWLALIVAIVVPSVVSAVVVAVMISLFEGRSSLTHLKISHLHLYYPATASIAVFSVLPVVLNPALGWLSVVPITATWLVLRSHGNLTQRYRDLNAVAGFAQTLNSSPHLDEVLVPASEHARTLLRADRALLAVRRWDSTLALQCATDQPDDDVAESLLTECDWDEATRVANSAIVIKNGSEDLPEALKPLRAHDAMIIPLRSREDLHGLVVVVDRSGIGSRFVQADLARGEAVAQQLAAAISNGRLHEEIRHQATHDPSTGLSNRQHLERLMNGYLTAGDSLALLMMQLGQVRDVQATLGTAAADELVRAVAQRLDSVIGNAMIARIQPNSLAIALPGATRDQAAALRAELLAVTNEPIELDGLKLSVFPSLGTALAPAHGTSAEDLLRRAGVAAETARVNHRPHCTYSTDIDHHSEQQLELLADLRSALDLGAVDVHFHPQINIATGIVSGAEALIRWTHPGRGPITPDEFIPAVEQSALMGEVTDYVVAKALTALESLYEADQHLSISVNVSGADLLDDQLPDRIARALGGSAVDPGQLTLEITETSFVSESATTRTTLDRLRHLGVKTSVDDFGTGYASLVYLRELATHEVKLEKRFINGAMFDDHDAHIVTAMIDLAHNLNLQVVAEGVENDQMLHWLHSAGCDVAQGNGIARPMSLEQLHRWLRSRSRRTIATTRSRS